MAYALTSIFEDQAVDPRQFTIFRDENTLSSVDLDLVSEAAQATGLDVKDVVQLKPERVAMHWLAGRLPFDVKVESDSHFLSQAQRIRDDFVLAETPERSWSKLTNDLADFRTEIQGKVSAAVAQSFDGETVPNQDLEVFEAVHQIRRTVTLRNDIGMSDFDDEKVKALTSYLAETYFYNREANERIKEHVNASISDAVSSVDDIKPLDDVTKKGKKHIHVSGGQGSGKTFLSRRSLGIKSDAQESSLIRINKDLFRPLVLSADDAARDLDLSQPGDRRQYGRLTEDELNIIKGIQWGIIKDLGAENALPSLHIDSTIIADQHRTQLLTQAGSKLTLLHLNTPFDEASRRVQERALGDGIPGIDSMRESLLSEVVAGHKGSAKETASMLIHGSGQPIKLKILDGRSPEKTRPVQAQVDLSKGVLDIYSSRAILEVFHKAEDGKTSVVPTDDDLREQIPNFSKIASVMTQINFRDPITGKLTATYDNGSGINVVNEKRFEDEFKGTLVQEVFDSLDAFHSSKKAAVLGVIAREKGRVFNQRRAFDDVEPHEIVTDQYETEVPLVDQSAYVDDDPDAKLLEWRHIAKRGKFLDGGFDPWRDKAPDDVRILAARQVVDNWLTDDVIESLADLSAEKVRDCADPSQPLTVHISHPLKDPTRPTVNINYMVLAYREELARRLNNAMEERHEDLNVTFAHDRPLMALASDRSTRTTASALQRLTSQPFYDTDIFDEGDLVLFADEHVQAGGVMLAARNIKNAVDINVVGYTALSSHNLGADLQINPNVSIALENAIDENARIHDVEPMSVRDDLDEALSQVGLARDTLSNIEGLILIAYLIDGSSEAKRSWFDGVKSSIGLGEEKIREGMDSLDSILMDDPLTARELGDRIDEQIVASRKAVYPSMAVE